MKCVLTSGGKQLPKWGYEQQEISCNPTTRQVVQCTTVPTYLDTYQREKRLRGRISNSFLFIVPTHGCRTVIIPALAY